MRSTAAFDLSFEVTHDRLSFSVSPSGRYMCEMGDGLKRLGFSFVGRHIDDVLKDEAPLLEFWRELLANPREIRRVIRAFGTWWDLEVHPLCDGPVYLGVHALATALVPTPETRGKASWLALNKFVVLQPVHAPGCYLQAGDVLSDDGETMVRSGALPTDARTFILQQLDGVRIAPAASAPPADGSPPGASESWRSPHLRVVQ
jgi:hypothetical protein